MDKPDDALTFKGLTLQQRHEVAVKQTTAVAKVLAEFLVSRPEGPAPNPKLYREATERALAAAQGLLKTLLLDELFEAGIVHKLGPPPPRDAPEDPLNLRAVKELHVVSDWVAEIAPRDSIDAVRADMRRLEEGQEPQVFRRDKYVDRRSRDHTERADREAAVLLVHYLAAKGEEKIPDLLERLKLGTSFSAFEKWSAEMPLEHRKLMTAAGLADREGRGLNLEQQATLSSLPRCLAVLNRHEAELFPGLAGLSDEDMVRKLFDRANRRRHFARSGRKPPPKRQQTSGFSARKTRKRFNKIPRK